MDALLDLLSVVLIVAPVALFLRLVVLLAPTKERVGR